MAAWDDRRKGLSELRTLEKKLETKCKQLQRASEERSKRAKEVGMYEAAVERKKKTLGLADAPPPDPDAPPPDPDATHGGGPE